MIVFILAGAYVFSWVIDREAIGENLTAFLQSITKNRYFILLCLNVVILVLGFFMNPLAIQLICVPVFLPLLTTYDISLIHFGLVLILNIQIGLCTPPVGNALFVVSDVANISFESMCKATLPFLLPLVVALLLITYIPDLVLFLPNLLFGELAQ